MTTSPSLQTITHLLTDLTTDEKRTLYYNLGHDLLDVDKQDVLEATRRLTQAYEATGITGIAVVEFRTSEYDNGHFYSPHNHTLIGADENTITVPTLDNLGGLDDTEAENLHEDLDGAFTTYADTSLGAYAVLTVDLANNTVNYTTS